MEEIKKNLHYVCENTVGLPVLLNHLQQHGVITAYDCQLIESKATSYEKNRELYGIVNAKGNDAFPKLTDSLKQSGNKVIAEKLLLNCDAAHINNNGIIIKRLIFLFFFLTLLPLLISNRKPIESTPINTPPVSSTNENIWFEVGRPTKYYSGRESEIEKLRDLEKTNELVFVGITGLGGIGKSELAKNYAKDFYMEGKGHVLWINAEKTTSVFHSFQRLSKILELSLIDDDGNLKSEEIVTTTAYKTLSSMETRSLFIFDNLENYDQHFLLSIARVWNNLPPTINRPFILMTSRSTVFRATLGDLSKHIELGVLTNEAAYKFVSRALDKDEETKVSDDENIIETLCKRLGNYPLALQQAVAYINQKSMHVTTKHQIEMYLQLMDHESKSLYEFPLPSVQTLDEVSQTTYMTWKVTLKKIMQVPYIGVVAINTMNILSLLSPENITIEFLSKISSKSKLGLEVLHSYSMCRFVQVDGVVNVEVHRLVQEVVRIHLNENDFLMNELLDALLKTIKMLLEDNKSVTVNELIHYESIWTHAHHQRESMKVTHEHIPHYLARCYHSLGRYKELREFSSAALELIFSKYSNENQGTVQKLLYWNGVSEMRLGNYDKAQKILMEVYNNQKELLGETHDDSLSTATEIGYNFYLKGMHSMSVNWMEEIVKRNQQVGKINHPSVLDGKERIAVCFNAQGKYEKAMEMYRDILQMREKVQGKDHTDIVRTKHNMASVMEKQGKFDQALIMYTEVLEVREKGQGGGHPDTLTTKNNIASVLEKLGKHVEALTMYNEVFEWREKVLGRDNPATLTTKHNIAVALYKQGNYREAIEMYNEVLERREKILGSDHPSTLTTQHCMAVVLQKQGKRNEALKVFKEVLGMRELVLERDHPDTLNTKHKIASVLDNQGKKDEALKLYREVLAVQEKVLGRDHPDKLNTKHNIASVLYYQGNYEEAVEMYEDVLEMRKCVKKFWVTKRKCLEEINFKLFN